MGSTGGIRAALFPETFFVQLRNVRFNTSVHDVLLRAHGDDQMSVEIASLEQS